MTDDTSARFLVKFESLSGKTCRAATLDNAMAYVMGVIGSNETRCVALGQLPGDLREGIQAACEARGISVLTPPYKRIDLPMAIDGAQVGVAMASHAIAETGTLIEITTDDGERLVSSLPRTYIGIVSGRNIVDRYYDAAPLLRTAFAENQQNCVVSFISGPSRTGDIELKLTLGVHGPGEAHAVVLDYDT
jgi:L-lactate dehydrogenase complex protein LldG